MTVLTLAGFIAPCLPTKTDKLPSGSDWLLEAPDRERAEAVAIKQFDLDQDQRSRLLIRERL
jgi:hypothetical protein